MFEAKMSGGPNDPDDLIVSAFKAFDEEGNDTIFGEVYVQTKRIVALCKVNFLCKWNMRFRSLTSKAIGYNQTEGVTEAKLKLKNKNFDWNSFSWGEDQGCDGEETHHGRQQLQAHPYHLRG